MSTAQKSAAQYQLQTIKEAAKAEPRDVILVKADDWTALYVDGKKIVENHSLTDKEIFDALGISIREIWVDDDWLDQTGYNFPPNSSELPH